MIMMTTMMMMMMMMMTIIIIIIIITGSTDTGMHARWAMVVATRCLRKSCGLFVVGNIRPLPR